MRSEKGKVIELFLICIILAIIVGIGYMLYNVYMQLDDNGKVAITLGNTSIVEIEKKDNSKIEISAGNDISSILDNIVSNSNTSVSSTNTTEQNKTYENTENTIYKYFYNQLENESKIIYDGLMKNKENLKQGNYTINYGESFSDLLQKEDGQEKLEQLYQTAIEAFIYDNSDVFYLEANKTYLNIQTTTYLTKKKFEVYLNSGEYNNYYIDGISSIEQINRYEKEIESVKNGIISNLSGDTVSKIKQIHDYIVDNIEYDSTISLENIYNIYGALVQKKCVCEGYAKAFNYLANAAGIESVIVIGTGIDQDGKTENHAWNYVNVDGTWYAIDTTWDDPIITKGGKLSTKSKYKYFLKGLNNINQDHKTTGQFTTGGKVFKYPIVNLSDYE